MKHVASEWKEIIKNFVAIDGHYNKGLASLTFIQLFSGLLVHPKFANFQFLRFMYASFIQDELNIISLKGIFTFNVSLQNLCNRYNTFEDKALFIYRFQITCYKSKGQCNRLKRGPEPHCENKWILKQMRMESFQLEKSREPNQMRK
jgi:hypothetical protein